MLYHPSLSGISKYYEMTLNWLQNSSWLVYFYKYISLPFIETENTFQILWLSNSNIFRLSKVSADILLIISLPVSDRETPWVYNSPEFYYDLQVSSLSLIIILSTGWIFEGRKCWHRLSTTSSLYVRFCKTRTSSWLPKLFFLIKKNDFIEFRLIALSKFLIRKFCTWLRHPSIYKNVRYFHNVEIAWKLYETVKIISVLPNDTSDLFTQRGGVYEEMFLVIMITWKIAINMYRMKSVDAVIWSKPIALRPPICCN